MQYASRVAKAQGSEGAMLLRLFNRCLSIPYRRVALGADYAVERIGDTLYLYFEDSNGAVDWYHNLDFLPATFSLGGKDTLLVHRGFLRVFRALVPHLGPLIDDARTKSLCLVGYSHGAALALLTHIASSVAHPSLPVRGYGFGCPHVIWGRTREKHAPLFSGFTVIRNLDDVVTHLPPAALFYRHVGRLLTVGTRGRYTSVDAHRAENILRELKRTADGVNSPDVRF